MAEQSELHQIDNQNFICIECKGYGLKTILTPCTKTKVKIFCPNCNGKGYLDWIEQIIGVKNNER